MWLHAGVRLDALTLAWDQAQAASDGAGARKTNRTERLERQIGRFDRQRSGLLRRILRTPARNAAEAVSKLRVAESLLDGEGGAEHDLVEDALRRFEADLGLKPARARSGL